MVNKQLGSGIMVFRWIIINQIYKCISSKQCSMNPNNNNNYNYNYYKSTVQARINIIHYTGSGLDVIFGHCIIYIIQIYKS